MNVNVFFIRFVDKVKSGITAARDTASCELLFIIRVVRPIQSLSVSALCLCEFFINEKYEMSVRITLERTVLCIDFIQIGERWHC